ncbi:hypothetical protein LEMLEM_LOCUS9032 [Lemmus lemmus]
MAWLPVPVPAARLCSCLHRRLLSRKVILQKILIGMKPS